MKLISNAMLATLLLTSNSAIAQDDLRSLRKSKDTPERLLSLKNVLAVKPRPTQADEIQEIRVFLTGRQGEVRGELQTNSMKGTKEITLMLENGAVQFKDDGQGADVKRSDGILSANFRMDVESEFKSLRTELKTFTNALRGDARNKSLKFGSRDIVPIEQGLERVSRTQEKIFERLQQDANISIKLAEFDSLPDAVKRLNINIKSTPFLTLSGPGNPNPFDKTKLFGVSILPIFPIASSITVSHDASLMVTNTSVVDDPIRSFSACNGTGTPGGSWSFGHLMRELSKDSGLTPEAYAQDWLANWATHQPGRAGALNAKVTNLWQALSGGTLNIDFFPATLTAIVNRPDLAGNIGYGSSGSAGEGRFVFALHGQQSGAVPGTCQAIPFTVIFEYGIDGGSCNAIKNWEQRWRDLDTFALGSAAYNVALENITRDFTDFGAARKGSLSQLRTNENALDSLWQLLEFRQNGTGDLDLTTVKQTPALSINNTMALQSYLEANESNILMGRHVVPDTLLASQANTPFGVFWNNPTTGSLNPATANDVRHKFSLNTCNGCHAGETNTFFTHIGTSFAATLGHRFPGTEVNLSGFLTGMSMPDPLDSGTTRTFGDLSARENAMSNILERSCIGLAAASLRTFVH